MSWKPEVNEPPGTRRGITSAEEVFREPFSEFERSVGRLLPETSSATMGRGKVSLDRQFHVMSSWTSSLKATAWCRELDMSNWSKRFRRPFFGVQSLLGKVFKAPVTSEGVQYDLASVDWLWNNLHLVIHKGGFHAEHHLTDGGVQGFPARSDTKMHSSILDYLRMILVRCKIFSEDDATFGACLIDDASFANRWNDTLSPEKAEWIAFWHPIITAKVYSDLGLKLDHIKTLWTSVTVLYLSRVFSDGIELPRQMQLASRIDVESDLRFVTHQTRASSVAANRDAAVIGGADPRVCSKIALYRMIELCVRTCKVVETRSTSNVHSSSQVLGNAGIGHSVARDSSTDKDEEVEFYHIAVLQWQQLWQLHALSSLTK